MTAIYWLGAHKTGTTFLQLALDRSADALAEHDVTYVELEEFRDRWTRPLLSDRASPDPDADAFTPGDGTTLVFDENIAGLVQHVLSRDGFYPDAARRLQRIASHLDLPPDEVVFGVRSYDEYLASLYIETLRSTPFRTFDQFLEHAFADDEGFARLNWHDVVRSWADAWPTGRVRVYRHDELRGNEARLLGEVLGIPADALTLPERVDADAAPWARSGVGMSGRAVEELHRIARHRTVEPSDVQSAEERHPPSDTAPTFAPWNDDQREALRAAYARDLAWIRADHDIEVIDLVPPEDAAAARTEPSDAEAPPARPVDLTPRLETGGDDRIESGPREADLSVVVPVHDAAATVPVLVETILSIDELRVQVVLVDDASSDDSLAVIRGLAADSDRVVALHHDHNRGAGVARNTGFATAIGRYTLFFDADDQLHPDALVAAVRGLDATGADVAMMSYHYRRGESLDTGMNTFDHETWEQYLGAEPRRLDRLDRLPRLLGFSNYPWNKVLRTEVYRCAGLRFGTTPVHNDILGHWYSLLFARSILLLNRPICTHIVGASGQNLTNRHSDVRLALFDALDETYDLLEANPGLRNRYSHYYWSMVLRVAGWAGSRIHPDHAQAFRLRLQTHLLRANLADFTRMRLKRDPGLADAILDKALS